MNFFGSISVIYLIFTPVAQCNGEQPSKVDSTEFNSQQRALRQSGFDDFRREYLTPIYNEIQTRKKLHLAAGKIVPSTDSDGPLLGDLEFEHRLWTQLAGDIMTRRSMKAAQEDVTRVYNRRNEFAREADNYKRLSGFKECDEALITLKQRLEKLTEADHRASTIILSLDELYDARAIRLLAPLMFEDDFEGTQDGDSGSGYFTQGIVGKIRMQHRMGVFKADLPPINFKSYLDEASNMRKWWIENREKFGPVYELPKVVPVIQPSAEAPSPPKAMLAPLALPPQPALLPIPAPSQMEIPSPKNHSAWPGWVATLVVLLLVAYCGWRKTRKSR